MNFGIPAIFAYADVIWTVGVFVAAFIAAFGAGWILGGCCER